MGNLTRIRIYFLVMKSTLSPRNPPRNHFNLLPCHWQLKRSCISPSILWRLPHLLHLSSPLIGLFEATALAAAVFWKTFSEIGTRLFCWQDQRGATARSRISPTRSHASAGVCLTLRSVSMTWAWRRRAWTSSHSVCIWCRGRRRMCRARPWRLRVLLAPSTWPSTQVRTLSTCVCVCTLSTCCASTRCSRARARIVCKQVCVVLLESRRASARVSTLARCCCRCGVGITMVCTHRRRFGAPSSSSPAAKRSSWAGSGENFSSLCLFALVLRDWGNDGLNFLENQNYGCAKCCKRTMNLCSHAPPYSSAVGLCQLPTIWQENLTNDRTSKLWLWFIITNVVVLTESFDRISWTYIAYSLVESCKHNLIMKWSNCQDVTTSWCVEEKYLWVSMIKLVEVIDSLNNYVWG